MHCEVESAFEALRGGGGSDNGPRIVLLESLDDVRRWMNVEEGTARATLKGFKQISIDEALELRRDDPELGAVVERAARLGLPLLKCAYPDTDADVAEMLPAPISRRLNALPLASSALRLAVLLNDPEGARPIEFAIARRVVPILARLNLVPAEVDAAGCAGATTGPAQLQTLQGSRARR